MIGEAQRRYIELLRSLGQEGRGSYADEPENLTRARQEAYEEMQREAPPNPSKR